MTEVSAGCSSPSSTLVPPSLPPDQRMCAAHLCPQCRRALLAPENKLVARGSFVSLHAKCLILHAKWELLFIGSPKSWYASPNTVSCIAPLTQTHIKSGTSPPHYTRTTKAVFIVWGKFYETEIITNILRCAMACPTLIIIPLQHFKCYLQSVSACFFKQKMLKSLSMSSLSLYEANWGQQLQSTAE